MKPPFRICGSKTSKSLAVAKAALHQILRDDDILVEPFCGSASVSIETGHKNIALFDAQQFIIDTHQAIKENPKRFLDSFEVLKGEYLKEPTQENYNHIRSLQGNLTDIHDRAAWFLFIVNAGYNWVWRVNLRGGCNTPYGKEDGVKKLKAAANRDDIMEYSRWLNSINSAISCDDFKDAFELVKVNHQKRNVFYIDPPYPDTFDQYTERRMKGRFFELSRCIFHAYIRGDAAVIQSSVDEGLASSLIPLCRLFVYTRKTKVQPKKTRKDWEMLLVTCHKEGCFDESVLDEFDVEEIKSESHFRVFKKRISQGLLSEA